MKATIPHPCSVCQLTPSLPVHERKPGALGTMAQSFAGSYRLCHSCLQLCKEIGAIDRWQQKSKKPRRDEMVTVYARTFQYLKDRRKTA